MPSGLLHFFPGPKQLIWAVDGKGVLHSEAWGGEEPLKGVVYDTMKPQPTTPGRYVIWSYAPYVTRTWVYSRIAWGTRLKLDDAKRVVLYETGNAQKPWASILDKMPEADLDTIRGMYRALYGTTGYRDADGDGIPEVWLFNDFGAMAVRYFKDKNKNHVLDKGESLSGEMIHTTPEDEADTSQGRKPALAPSHGCIHVPPTKRDAFRAAGAFKRGNDFWIHKYEEAVPASLK